MLLFVTLISLNASAHEIEGTLVLKGAIKTKVLISDVKTTCRAKIDKVKNLMLEDSFGNPAYKVKVSMSLSGNDKDISINYNRDFEFNNLFKSGSGSTVKDLEYAAADGAKMVVSSTGRIDSITFNYNHRPITCSF